MLLFDLNIKYMDCKWLSVFKTVGKVFIIVEGLNSGNNVMLEWNITGSVIKLNVRIT